MKINNMEKTNVRIHEIQLRNFKNVRFGKLNLTNAHPRYKASVLGLYGQNGSGKTALIDALQIIKILLTGHSLPASAADAIYVDANECELEISFSVVGPQFHFELIYQVRLKRTYEQEGNYNCQGKETAKTSVISEKLKWSSDSQRRAVLIDTETDHAAFKPASKQKLLLGGGKPDLKARMYFLRQQLQESGRSFLFSKEFLHVVKQNAGRSEEADRIIYLLNRLAAYGNLELFVVDTRTPAMVALNAMPLTFKLQEKQKACGQIMLPLDQAIDIPEDYLDVAESVITNINIVLQQIIPGLTVGLKRLNPHLMADNTPGCNVQLVSLKNAKEIPLANESEGIKKIINILSVLIAVYNSPTVTAAIDELDAGIFEYLLGRLVKIISERGKGQLIFTSHNLRPLETLDKGFVAFTSANPDNRYVRLANVKTNNNLREVYFRDILVSAQKERLYEPTSDEEIAFAFREAWQNAKA